jgi:hypothetical protein
LGFNEIPLVWVTVLLLAFLVTLLTRGAYLVTAAIDPRIKYA